MKISNIILNDTLFDYSPISIRTDKGILSAVGNRKGELEIMDVPVGVSEELVVRKGQLFSYLDFAKERIRLHRMKSFNRSESVIRITEALHFIKPRIK